MLVHLKQWQIKGERDLKLRPNFALFHPYKVRGGMGEMFESVFRIWPTTQPLIYFWVGCCSVA